MLNKRGKGRRRKWYRLKIQISRKHLRQKRFKLKNNRMKKRNKRNRYNSADKINIILVLVITLYMENI